MKKISKQIYTAFLAVLIVACTSSKKETVVINLLPVRVGAAFSYIDPQGKIIINPQFKEATVFRNGVGLVQVSGIKPMWGFIHEDGSFAVKANYKQATVFSEEVAWVISENGAPEAITPSGDSIFTLKEAKTVRIFKNGLAAFSVCVDSVNVKWGFVYKNGMVRIKPQYSAVGNYSDGKCAVANSAGECGYIDQEGKVIINLQFTSAYGFINGKAIVQLGKEWGVIDEKGKFLINPTFTAMKADQNLYIVKQNNKWGWCNQNGKIVIQPQFKEAYPFNQNELAPVKSGDKFGFINKKGKMIIDAQFEAALPFIGNIAWAVKEGKGGFINKNGKFIIQPHYEAISEDAKTYLLTGTSTNERVNTEYFDLDAIVTRLKTDITENTVAGMNFNTPMSYIFKKFKKPEVDFIKNASEHKIISAERISNDATIDFYLLGTPWNEKYNGKLGFSYTLKPGYEHTGFTYKIILTTNGLGKEGILLKSLETALKGYVKDEKHSNEDVLILQSKYQLIIGLKQKGLVIVAIYPVTSDNLKMVDLNYGDGTEADSTSVVTDTVAHK